MITFDTPMPTPKDITLMGEVPVETDDDRYVRWSAEDLGDAVAVTAELHVPQEGQDDIVTTINAGKLLVIAAFAAPKMLLSSAGELGFEEDIRHLRAAINEAFEPDQYASVLQQNYHHLAGVATSSVGGRMLLQANLHAELARVHSDASAAARRDKDIYQLDLMRSAWAANTGVKLTISPNGPLWASRPTFHSEDISALDETDQKKALLVLGTDCLTDSVASTYSLLSVQASAEEWENLLHIPHGFHPRLTLLGPDPEEWELILTELDLYREDPLLWALSGGDRNERERRAKLLPLEVLPQGEDTEVASPLGNGPHPHEHLRWLLTHSHTLSTSALLRHVEVLPEAARSILLRVAPTHPDGRRVQALVQELSNR